MRAWILFVFKLSDGCFCFERMRWFRQQEGGRATEAGHRQRQCRTGWLRGCHRRRPPRSSHYSTQLQETRRQCFWRLRWSDWLSGLAKVQSKKRHTTAIRPARLHRPEPGQSRSWQQSSIQIPVDSFPAVRTVDCICRNVSAAVRTVRRAETENKSCNVQKCQTGKDNVSCDADEVLIHVIDPDPHGQQQSPLPALRSR